jgi:hypothetical protein
MAEVSTITAEDQKRTIDNWAKLWSAHDMQRLLQIFTEDAVYEDVTMGEVNRGAAAIRTFGEGFLTGFPDVTFDAIQLRQRRQRQRRMGDARDPHTGSLPNMAGHWQARGSARRLGIRVCR